MTEVLTTHPFAETRTDIASAVEKNVYIPQVSGYELTVADQKYIIGVCKQKVDSDGHQSIEIAIYPISVEQDGARVAQTQAKFLLTMTTSLENVSPDVVKQAIAEYQA